MKKIIFMIVFSLTALTATEKAKFTISNSGILDSSTSKNLTNTASSSSSETQILFYGSKVIPNTVQQVWDDMYGKNTGWVSNMQGGYKQFQGPIVRILRNIRPYTSVGPWIEIEAGGNGSGCSLDTNQATNTRVEFGYTRAYVLIGGPNGRWVKISDAIRQQQPYGDGAAHPSTIIYNPLANFPNWSRGCGDPQDSEMMEAFHANGNRNPTISRIEENGFQSVKPIHYFRWHGWPHNNLASYNDNDVYAIFAEIHARLIIENPKLRDDRHLANYVIHMGSDVYDRTKSPGSQYKGDTGISRYKKVTNDWQPVNMLSGDLTKEQLEANPPPFTNKP